ncbi:hypothetical protein N878_27035 [Pseudomonas sp. EGD-AK9]|nr:hypothetical protein N878_27035 [Pseudomonas sp. EGD-AK9]
MTNVPMIKLTRKRTIDFWQTFILFLLPHYITFTIRYYGIPGL